VAEKQNILLVRPDHIGDLILTTPALHALRSALPDAHITIVVGSWSASILNGNPDPNEIMICDLPWLARGTTASWNAVIGTLKDIRPRHYDHILSFRVAAKAALFSRLCGGNRRWGFNVAKSRWAWTDAVEFHSTQHVVDNYLNLVSNCVSSILGEFAPEPLAKFSLYPTEEDEAHIDEILAESDPPIILGVTSGRPEKAWRADRWAEVADHVVTSGYPVAFSGAPSEAREIESVREQMKQPSQSLVGMISVIQFAALLKRCPGIITLDSSAVHFATAVRTPTIALYGSTSSTQWGPYPTGQPTIAVEPPLEIPRNSRIMDWIQVHHVADAFDQLQEKIAK